ALAAVMLGLITCLWDSTARFTLAGMYAAGVTALGLWLSEAPVALHWAAPLLALFVTLTTAWWRAVRAQPWLRDSFGGSLPPRGWPTGWFPPVQSLLIGVVFALSLWLCLTGETGLVRLRGPLALVLLLPTALLFVDAMPASAVHLPLAPRSLAQYATLLLGA